MESKYNARHQLVVQALELALELVLEQALAPALEQALELEQEPEQTYLVQKVSMSMVQFVKIVLLIV